MLTRLLSFALLTFLLSSCDRSNQPVETPNSVPVIKDQKVISSIINEKAKTIAIIYGNDLALQAAGDSSDLHRPGEIYTMVSWKQRQMPNWYGTNMNGQLLTIESVNVSQDTDGQLLYSYQVQPSPQIREDSPFVKRDQRINFIISQLAAVFPQ